MSVGCAINDSHVHLHRSPVFLVLWLSEANGGGAGAILLN